MTEEFERFRKFAGKGFFVPETHLALMHRADTPIWAREFYTWKGKQAERKRILGEIEKMKVDMGDVEVVIVDDLKSRITGGKNH